MSPNSNPGPGVDAQGNPVIDPTQNVLDLVEAAIKRQDDLREAEGRHVREVIGLRAEMASIRAAHATELRMAEAARIDAIRSIDVGGVQRTAEVAQERADTLAAQVANAAEAFRASLTQALDPIKTDIADLRRAQYEQQGIKAQTLESGTTSRSNIGVTVAAISAGIAFISIIASIVIALVVTGGSP